MKKKESEVIGTRVPTWMPPALEMVRRLHPKEFDSRNAVQVEAFRRLLAEYGIAAGKGMGLTMVPRKANDDLPVAA